MIVRATTTVVWSTPHGRRYLTKAAAYRRAAWDAIVGKYPCDCIEGEISHAGGVDDTGNMCVRHAGNEHWQKVVLRLARWMARADRSGV